MRNLDATERRFRNLLLTGGTVKGLSAVVSLTYGEFQAWYNYGETSLASQRLFLLEDREFTNESRPSVTPLASALLARIPQLALDDEEGVLLVRLQPRNIERAPFGDGLLDSQTVTLQIRDVEEVIPLTDRARRILDPRARALGIRLSPAYFEAEAQEVLGLRGVRRALRGGDALVELLFDVSLDWIHDTYGPSASDAIRGLDNRTAIDRTPSHDPESLEAWISFAFQYTRHDPYNEGNLGYLIDAGKVLKDSWQDDPERVPDLAKYREIVKHLRTSRKSDDALDIILADRMIAGYSGDLWARGVRTFPDGLAPLPMFLRWKDLFHKNGDSVDFDSLLADTPTLVKMVGYRPTILGVWLLGCFAGYEGIAPELYRAGGGERYQWYSGSVRRVQKITEPTAPIIGATGVVSHDQESTTRISTDDEETGVQPREIEEHGSSKDLVPIAQSGHSVAHGETDRAGSTQINASESRAGVPAQQMAEGEKNVSVGVAVPEQDNTEEETLTVKEDLQATEMGEKLPEHTHVRDTKGKERKRAGRKQGKNDRGREKSNDQTSRNSKSTKADVDGDGPHTKSRDLFDGATLKESGESDSQ